jgi:hypothetical protein
MFNSAYFSKALRNLSKFDVFHKRLDCVSETTAAEMRTAYNVGFKDGVTLMKEI